MKFMAAILALAACASAQVGPSGIVSPDGNNIQFSHDFANDVVVSGPSGIVTRSGNNLQLTQGQATLNQAVPAAAPPTWALPIAAALAAGAVPGPSGIVLPDGRNIQFTQEQADNIAVIGHSGIVFKNGQNLQFSRKKRSPQGFSSAAGNIGTAGILRADGTTDLFSHDLAHDIVLIGHSGIVTKSGRNIQLTSDLNIANPLRAKRSLPLVGPSGMITADGTPIQFTKEGVTILLEGPSGYVMSDGTLVQKRSKRHLIGPSAIIASNGQMFQLPAGVTVVSAGDSGFVLSNGQNIQLSH